MLYMVCSCDQQSLIHQSRIHHKISQVLTWVQTSLIYLGQCKTFHNDGCLLLFLSVKKIQLHFVLNCRPAMSLFYYTFRHKQIHANRQLFLLNHCLSFVLTFITWYIKKYGEDFRDTKGWQHRAESSNQKEKNFPQSQ